MSPWAGRTAFVTGAYGMLGSRLTAALLDRGARVVVLRRDRAPGSALVLEGLQERCHVVDGSVTHAATVERAIAEQEVDTVVHLAAQTLVGVANRAPRSTFETNVAGTWTVLEAARASGTVRRVVVASSDKAYGPSDELPYREDHPLGATHPYDVSKACADLVARSYAHAFALPVATTRCANLYGPGDLNASRLVPELVAAVLAGRAPVIRSDGSPRRDFLHVDDAVEAYLAICDLLDAGQGHGEAFNAGSEVPVSVREVAEELVALGAGPPPEYRGTGVPPGEIDAQWVDATRLRTLTGWRARTSLQDGLRDTLEWYRAHPATARGPG